MARNTETKLKGQAQVDRRDLYDYSPRRSVVARPVDAYVQPGRSQNLQMFAESMQQLTGGVTATMNAYGKDAEERGQTSAMKGEAAPESATAAFVRGYETFKGRANVGSYMKRLGDLYNRSGDLTSEEWMAEKEKIHQEMLNGASDNYVRGFVPDALRIEEAYDQKFQKDQFIHVKNSFLSTTREEAETKLDLIFNDDSIADKGQAVRDALSAAQETAKGLNGIADRTEVSDQFLEAVGERAVREGKPEYLSFIYKKDGAGHALITRPELADKANQYLDAALSRQATLENKAIKDRNKLIANAKEDIERQVVWALETGEFTEAGMKLGGYRTVLDATFLQQQMKRLDELTLDSNWAKRTHAESYDGYHQLAVRGEWGPEMRGDAHKRLTREAYLELAKLNTKAKDGLRKAGPGVMMNFDDMKRAIHAEMYTGGPSDELGRLFDADNARKRYSYIERTMNRRLQEFLKTSSMDQLSMDVLEQWRKTISEGALKEAPFGMMLTRHLKGEGEGGSSQPSTTSGNPAKPKPQASTILDRLKNSRVKE